MGGGTGVSQNDAGAPTPIVDAGIVAESGPDAGGDCPAVCPPSSTENFCDTFNRSDPTVATMGWRLAPDNTGAPPSIEAMPCGHLVVDAGAAVQMLERPLAEAVNVIVTFDLTMQIEPADAGSETDAGAPAVTVLALGASEGAIAEGAGVTVFYTATQVGVSIGNASSTAFDVPPGSSRHFVLAVTGRASNFSATATLSIAGGPDVVPAVAQRFTAVPFKVLQLGLRNDRGLGHASARIDNLGVYSQ